MCVEWGKVVCQFYWHTVSWFVHGWWHSVHLMCSIIHSLAGWLAHISHVGWLLRVWTNGRYSLRPRWQVIHTVRRYHVVSRAHRCGVSGWRWAVGAEWLRDSTNGCVKRTTTCLLTCVCEIERGREQLFVINLIFTRTCIFRWLSVWRKWGGCSLTDVRDQTSDYPKQGVNAASMLVLP